MTIKDILNEIRKKRLSLNYSQENMATQLGITQSAYNKIENGTRDLTVKMLLKIKKFLGMN